MAGGEGVVLEELEALAGTVPVSCGEAEPPPLRSPPPEEALRAGEALGTSDAVAAMGVGEVLRAAGHAEQFR